MLADHYSLGGISKAISIHSLSTPTLYPRLRNKFQAFRHKSLEDDEHVQSGMWKLLTGIRIQERPDTDPAAAKSE